jgi:hypothetical protein
LTKGIEAIKLHPRTGLPLGVPPVTVPYGAFIEPMGSDRDRERFMYLGDLCEVTREVFLSATGGAWGDSHPPAAEAAGAAAAPAPALAEKAPELAAPAVARLQWYGVNSSDHYVKRAAVPGGWLVSVDHSVIFVADPRHEWNGGSVE